MTNKMKMTAVLFAATALTMSVPVMAEYYTTPDGAIVLDIPDKSWEVINDAQTVTTLSNGTGTITVLHYSADNALPTVAVPGENYAASYQVVMADKSDIYVITGSVTDKAYLPDVRKIVQSATYYEENPYAGPTETATTTVTTASYDIQTKLNQTAETAGAMEKRLEEDASLTQNDMNNLSYEIYMVWDDTLNELWQLLNESLDEGTMNQLLNEQLAWITEKENAAQAAGEAYGDGSLASLASNQKAAEMTKTRVYELAAYFS